MSGMTTKALVDIARYEAEYEKRWDRVKAHIKDHLHVHDAEEMTLWAVHAIWKVRRGEGSHVLHISGDALFDNNEEPVTAKGLVDDLNLSPFITGGVDENGKDIPS